MTKCQKDPTSGIFLKRGLFKGIKNYILMCKTSKYKNTNTKIHTYNKWWSAWKNFLKEDCSRISEMIFPYVKHGNTGADALLLMHRRSCTEGDALGLMQWRRSAKGDALKVIHCRWCDEGDALTMMHWRWCTEGLIRTRIISRTFLAQSALVDTQQQ